MPGLGRRGLTTRALSAGHNAPVITTNINMRVIMLQIYKTFFNHQNTINSD